VPGFGGYSEIHNSDSMYAKTRADPGSTFDDRHFLKIRLIDALVGDWDRHSGQWRWGVERTRSGALWRAIPEDRDWAFAATDGPVAWVARWVLPSYVGFGPTCRHPAGSPCPASAWTTGSSTVSARKTLRKWPGRSGRALPDSVIESALDALQPEYAALERDHLGRLLKARRDQLLDYAVRYYRYLAGTVHVYGFDGSADIVEFERVSEKRARVRVRTGGPDGPVRFERLIDARETNEVQLFIDEGVDRIVGGDDLPFKVTIAKDQPDRGESRRP
jgi:hypothetical protein